jgi:prepilin-type N-terminal cleavage/methylation domain-containing protein
MRTKYRIQVRFRAGRGAAKTGFTLIELLVVIAILAVLAALGFGAYQGVIARADSAKSLSQMRGIGAALMTFSGENRGKMPSAFGWPERFGVYEKPKWVAGTIGQDWASDMWIWALVNAQNLPLQAFTSPQTDKQLKSLGFGPYPAFMLNQAPALPDLAKNRSFFTAPARFTRPSKTILLSQVAFDRDTVGNRNNAFCNFWGDWGILHAVANQKLGIPKTPFIFVDGHAEMLAPSETLGSEATGGKDTTRWFDPSMFPNTWWASEAACARYLRGRLP